MEASYRSQVQQAETQLADRILEAEATARRAAAELETARADLDAMREDLQAARGEAESREQRVLQAHEELLKARQETKDLAKEIKERSTTVAQAHKDTDDIRRSLAAAQADLTRADVAAWSAWSARWRSISSSARASSIAPSARTRSACAAARERRMSSVSLCACATVVERSLISFARSLVS